MAESLETSAASAPLKWPIEESKDTPKLCLAPGDGGGSRPAGRVHAAHNPLVFLIVWNICDNIVFIPWQFLTPELSEVDRRRYQNFTTSQPLAQTS